MKEDKNKILKYRVTYLEMIKYPSYSYPNCPIKFTNIIKSNNVPYWYFISLYKSVGEEYEWTDMLKQKKEITENFLNNKNILDQKKSAFFSVNVVARKPEKNTAETNPYINKFLKISKWKPNKISVFAGKVDYPNYNFFDKYIIKFIMFITKGPTDTSQSYEFTDWSKVDDFSEEFRNNY